MYSQLQDNLFDSKNFFKTLFIDSIRFILQNKIG